MWALIIFCLILGICAVFSRNPGDDPDDNSDNDLTVGNYEGDSK